MEKDFDDLQAEAVPDVLAENGTTTPEAGFGQEYTESATRQNEQQWTGAGDETRVYVDGANPTPNVPGFGIGRDLF